MTYFGHDNKGNDLITLYFVFVAGKRSCLGEQMARQEVFLFLVSLLQNFNIKPAEGQDCIDVHEVWGAANAPSAYKVRFVERDA